MGNTQVISATGENALLSKARNRSHNLSRYVNIVRELAVADFRLKYHDSALGYLWSMLNPVLMFGVFYFVFTYVFFVGIPDYALYLIIGIVTYNFFQDCTFSAMNAIGGKAPIIKKIYFPRYLIILASSTTSLFSLVVNVSVVLVFVFLARGIPTLFPLILIPLLSLILFSIGVSFLLATLYVYFRDMGQIWGVLVLALFWLTPVVYDITALPESTQTIVYFNPLTRIFVMLRHYLLYDYFDLRFLVMSMLYSTISFVVGLYVFRKFQDKFAEHL